MADAPETWTARTKDAETWERRTQQAETWVGRTADAETWLPRGYLLVVDAEGRYVLDGAGRFVYANG